MDALHAALDEYAPYDDAEERDLARGRALLEAGDPWSRDRPLHLTASALVVHPPTRRVLLRWHPRLGGWFQVGGHADPGEDDPWAIALREAEEETGLPDLGPVTPAHARVPVQVVAVPVPAAKGEPDHEHLDVRFVLTTRSPEAARAESADAPVRWHTLPEARAAVRTSDLRDLLDRVARVLGAVDRPDDLTRTHPEEHPT